MQALPDPISPHQLNQGALRGDASMQVTCCRQLSPSWQPALGPGRVAGLHPGAALCASSRYRPSSIRLMLSESARLQPADMGMQVTLDLA